MQRHILDRAHNGETGRLPRYLTHERNARIRGPHHAVNVLRRLPRGATETSDRVRSYLEIERHGKE